VGYSTDFFAFDTGLPRWSETELEREVREAKGVFIRYPFRKGSTFGSARIPPRLGISGSTLHPRNLQTTRKIHDDVSDTDSDDTESEGGETQGEWRTCTGQ